MAQKLETFAGTHIHDVLSAAVGKAISTSEDVTFDFNGHTFTAKPGDTLADAKARWRDQTGIEPITPEQSAERALIDLERMTREQADAIANAVVLTESQLRALDVPWPKTTGELVAFIESVVGRPHDYGTCVYAISLAATAAFQYAAVKVGASGFQASCADMDILRRTRRLRHGFKIIDYEHLLYPQYLDDEKMPGWQVMLNATDIRDRLRDAAKTLLDERPIAIHSVIAHWRKIVSDETF